MEDLKKKSAQRLFELLDYSIENYKKCHETMIARDIPVDQQATAEKEMLYGITQIACEIGRLTEA